MHFFKTICPVCESDKPGTKCTCLVLYMQYLKYVNASRYNDKGKRFGAGRKVDSVIGINDAGLRRYDYQRKLNQHYKRAA